MFLLLGNVKHMIKRWKKKNQCQLITACACLQMMLKRHQVVFDVVKGIATLLVDGCIQTTKLVCCDLYKG